jgi:hypothetical protein
MARLIGTLVLLLSCTSDAVAQSDDLILLRVRVTDAQYTDYYPAADCVDEGTCFPFYFWFKYSARVREVISGSYPETHIEFANLQHTYFISRVTRDWLVLLEPCGRSVVETVQVELCVRRHAISTNESGREELLSEFGGGE